jgi:Flp pilus assembly protein CpaB
MKQKNLILVAVAVGCGLVAAFLTSQMTAGPAMVQETVEIPVAAKDLPVGTMLKKADLKGLVTYKKVPKDNLPAAFAATEDELTDKRLMRMQRAGEAFNPADLTSNAPINPPPGFNLYTIASNNVDAAAGFIGPGSRVDVVCSVIMQSLGGRAVIFPLLIDQLVLAIDDKTQFNASGTFVGLSMVSLALTNDHILMLKGATTRNAKVSLVLRNPEKPPVWKKIFTEQEVWAILADDPKQKYGDDGTPLGKKDEEPSTIKLPVPTEDLPAGTQITTALIEEKIKYVDFTPPAPANIVVDLAEFEGKYLTQPVTMNQFIPKAFIGGKPTKPGADDDDTPPAPKQALVEPDGQKAPQGFPKAVEQRPVYHDVTIQHPFGTRSFRYQKLADGAYKYLGELKKDGSLGDPTQPEPAKPQPAKPAGPTKPDAAEDDENDAPAEKKPEEKKAEPKKPEADKKAEPKKPAERVITA